MTGGGRLARRLATGLVALAAGYAGLAGSPARATPLSLSPIPPLHHGSPDMPPAVAPSTPAVAPSAPAIARPTDSAPLTSAIPPARNPSPPPLSQPALQPSPEAPLASLIPPPRPRTLLASFVAPAPAPTAPPDPTQGALCGDPALGGHPVATIRSATRGCGLVGGVEITRIAGLALSQPALVDCPTALSLSRWTQTVLLPSARNLNLGIAGLELADSYACRPRNNVPGSKISEHGRGAAIDIAGITLKNGDSISVLDDWNRGRKGLLLATIRRAACGLFTTVLGPGSDRFHRGHLHFDTARGRGPYCR